MKNADSPAMPMFNENGAAIHHSNAGLHEGCLSGLTKREMFAMNTMQGLLSGNMTNSLNEASMTAGVSPDVALSKMAVELADALLTELDKCES